MPWYHIQLSLDDLATGKHIRLQNEFGSLWLDRRMRPGAAMFGNANPKDDYAYYFLLQKDSSLATALSAFDARPCAPPPRESVVLLVGDPSALDAG